MTEAGGAAASDRAPEAGQRRPVLVARPEGRGGALVEQLEADGFLVEHRPFLGFHLAGVSDLRRDLTDLAGGVFTHLVVTSRTTVEALAPSGDGPSRLTVHPSTRVLAVGEGTASALSGAGVRVDVVAGGSGAALVAQMPSSAGEDLVWLPASAAASATVPDGLRAKGYRVRRTDAYRPQPLEQPAEVTEGLPAGRYGALVVTSPMIARLAAEIGLHPSTPVVSIGDPTSHGARAAGLTVAIQARTPDDAALADAVRRAVDQAAGQAAGQAVDQAAGQAPFPPHRPPARSDRRSAP